jgi:hypothetical protein
MMRYTGSVADELSRWDWRLEHTANTVQGAEGPEYRLVVHCYVYREQIPQVVVHVTGTLAHLLWTLDLHQDESPDMPEVIPRLLRVVAEHEQGPTRPSETGEV